MRHLNKVFLIGNLGKEPEVRYTPSGTPVATVSICTNMRVKDKAGEWSDRPEWHTLKLWGKQAENAQKYLKKGSRLHVEGRNQTDSWEDKESRGKKYRTFVVVESFIMLDSAPGNEEQQQMETDIPSEEIPF